MAAQVARGFFALAEAQSQQTLAGEAQSTFEKTAEAVKERFKGGAEQGGMAAQLRLAESDAATAKAAVEERKQMVNALSRQLETLVGRYPAGSLRVKKSLPAMPGRPPAGLPSELLLRRPDVLSAERQLASQGMRIREAWKALYPRFSLTGSVGTSTDALKNILNSDFGIWQLGANIVEPIFYGGRVKAEVDIRYGKDRELAAQLHKTMLKAFAEVEIALSAEGELARREAAVRQASSLAEEAYQAANADYRDGVGDMLTVLTAQARAVNARSQIVALQRARLDNRVQLHLALGGDYKPKASATPATPPQSARGTGLKSFLTRLKK
jgi:NodT family efflux transporter outer membrane factor (OMF) lipoprotein